MTVFNEPQRASRQPAWRAIGGYLPTNASKTGLLEETRIFLQTLERLRDLGASRQALVDGALPQRARETRETIVTVLQQRLVRWSPPQWVFDDLIAFANDQTQPSLEAALLLHVVRQDTLLYDFVQRELNRRWADGDHTLIRADVQRFLDRALPEHPEIDTWSRATREKLAGNMLSILRDYGLLRGREVRQIVEPVVPDPVVTHLIRLLQEEGIPAEALANQPDWQIWLWSSQRARQAVAALTVREA